MYSVRIGGRFFVVPGLDFLAGGFVECACVREDVLGHGERFGNQFLVGNPVEPAEHPGAALLVAFEVACAARLQVDFGDFEPVLGAREFREPLH